jgi:hypothetical protein
MSTTITTITIMAPSKILSEVIKRDIERTLNYSFRDPNLLFEALQAAGNRISKVGVRNVPDGNKRLAMLGDAVLTVAILSDWYEGEDTRSTWVQFQLYSLLVRSFILKFHLTRLYSDMNS